MNENQEKKTDWMEQLSEFSAVQVDSLGVGGFLVVLGMSLIASFYIALLYHRFYQSRATGSQAHHAFPLLGLSVTAIFICIQFSLPLSLGLLGALSIVRFRTPIKEPEEVGFIMLVIASSICCATFNFVFLGLILGVAYIGLMITRWAQTANKGKVPGGMMTITLTLEDYQRISGDLMALLMKHIPEGTLDGMQEGDNAATISYSFPAQQSNLLIKVQSEIRELATSARSSLYVHHAGAL